METQPVFPPVHVALRLQFGHGCDAVETAGSATFPEPWISFNSATVVTPWKPRRSTSSVRRRQGLQFGHGCDAVETAVVVTIAPGYFVLQFGHGCDAVETLAFAGATRITSGLQFGHGCDAVETCLSKGSTSQHPELQFGHGCDAVETAVSPADPFAVACFNSATVVTPWKRRGRRKDAAFRSASIRPRL